MLFCVCASLTACSDYCLNVQTNPGGTINTGTTCGATTTTGNVAVSFGSSLADSEATLVRAPQIFVTLRGIDGFGAPQDAEDASVWHELAPQLAAKPAQVELTAHSGESCAIGALGSAAVPAGVYHQLRLRLVPNLPSDRSGTAAPLLEHSACGANVFSCLIPSGAAPQPLAGDDSAEVVIPSDRIAGGVIRVSPNSSVHLSIAFDPVSSRALADGPAVRLIPSFFVPAHPSCPSPE